MGVPLIATAVGLQAIGQISSAQSAEAAADYNEALAKEDAKVAELATTQRKRALRKQGLRDIASIESAVSKSGVTMEGSPEDAIALAVESLARDETTLELEGLMARRRIQSQGDMARMQGENAQRQLPFQLGSTALMAAGALS